MCVSIYIYVFVYESLHSPEVAEAVAFPNMAELVALVLCSSFVSSLFMYLVSILAVLWTPSPSTVVRRASWRALSFPFGFLLTVFPQWLVYTGLKHDPVFGHLATLAVYSNGRAAELKHPSKPFKSF